MSDVITHMAAQAVRIQQLEASLARANDARLRVMAGWITEALEALNAALDDNEDGEGSQQLERLIQTGTRLVDSVVDPTSTADRILTQLEPAA